MKCPHCEKEVKFECDLYSDIPGAVFVVNDDSESLYEMERAFLKAEEYKPQAGDVVEFENKGVTLQAIVYEDGSYGLASIDNTTRVCNLGYYRKLRTHKALLRKIGSIDVAGLDTCNKVRKLASKYFGHSVEGKPTNQPSTNSKKLGSFIPTGSFEERTKAWCEYYNIKKGSKVKVVRTARQTEDGWNCAWVQSGMNELVGKVHTIDGVVNNGPKINGWTLPYFVLQVVD